MTVVSAREQHIDADAAPTKSFCALVIDGHAVEATAVRAALTASTAADFAVLRAPSLDSGIDALLLDDIDVVLICDDLLAPEGVSAVLEAAGGRPVLALTRSDDTNVATRLIDAGLHDAIPSGPAADDLGSATVRSIHRAGATRDPIDTASHAAPGTSRPAAAPSAFGATEAIRRQVAEARTPLAALIDLLDLLASAWDALAEEQRLSMLSSVRSYAAMVDHRTADLVAGAEADRSVPTAPAVPAPQPVGLAQAVSRALSLTGVDASTDIDPNIVVWVDPRQLDEMLTALLTRVAHRSLPPVRATATRGGTSVRLSFQGGGAPAGPSGGWSLLHPNPMNVGEVDDLDLDLDGARRLAESNGGVAGTGEQPGSAWLRLPSTPPDPALA